MPQCKAKFCTVKRGDGSGTSAFAIPDPKKSRSLCEQWIVNLGTENLNIKTFVYSKSHIVCEKHFEEKCFKEDLQAKLLGYTPKYRHLNPDAVPTIFEDSKPTKKREMSEKRLEKKRHDEEIEHILNESVIGNQATSDQPSTSSMDNETSATVKQKRLNNRELKTGKKRKENVSPSTRDVGIQVSPQVLNKEEECSISIDQVPTDKCANCFARENPALIMCDHLYSTNDQNKLHETDTHSMQNKEEFLLNMSDEKTNEDIDECMFKTPEKEYNDDPTYVPSDSDISPQKSSPPNARVKFNQFVKFTSSFM